MKKLVCLALALLLCLAICTPFKNAVKAEGTAYDVTIPEGGNLATNRFNWQFPTLSAAEFTFDETAGVKMENLVKDQQCTTVFNGGRFGEFKLSMYADLHFNVPTSKDYVTEFYSGAFITFLIDRDQEDILAEDSKPWYAHKVYMGLEIGFAAADTPVCRFIRYNAFAGNCSHTGQSYQGSSVQTAVNKLLDENTKHWVELEVKNFVEEDGSGKEMKAYIDGELAASYKYYDDLYYDSDSKKEYDVNISERDGAIGIYAQSSWPAGYPLSRMNNYLAIEKMSIINYDNNPEGEYVPQCTEPEYDITRKEYITAASYLVGDPIEIPLADLFEYEGTREVTYEATCDGEPIGDIINGFWAWTPTKAGSYDVDIKGIVTEENSVTNYITIRVEGDEQPTSPPTSTPDGDKDDDKVEKKGCGNVMSASVLLGGVALALGFVTLKKKQD